MRHIHNAGKLASNIGRNENQSLVYIIHLYKYSITYKHVTGKLVSFYKISNAGLPVKRCVLERHVHVLKLDHHVIPFRFGVIRIDGAAGWYRQLLRERPISMDLWSLRNPRHSDVRYFTMHELAILWDPKVKQDGIIRVIRSWPCTDADRHVSLSARFYYLPKFPKDPTRRRVGTRQQI